MKNKLSLIVIVLLSCITTLVQAQNDSIAPYDEVYSFDSAAFEPDTCFMPKLVSTSVAYYGTQAWLHLEVDTPDVLANLYYYRLYESGLQIGSTVQTTNGQLVFSGLDINKTYTIKVNNTCAIINPLIDVTTTFVADSEVVYMSDKMMNGFEAWVADSTKRAMGLYSYVNSLTNIHLIEKVSFLQQWSLTSSLPALTAGTMPSAIHFNLDPNYIPPGSIDACNCKMSIVVRPRAHKIEQVITVNNPDRKEGSINPFSGSTNNGWGQGNYQEGDQRYGVGKYTQLKGQRFDDGTHTVEFTAGDGVRGAHSSYIRVGLMCLDPNFKPNDCGCDREFNLEYQYDTYMKADAKVNNCFLCIKEAKAEAEETVFLGINDTKTSTFSIIDGKRKMVTASDNVSYNPDFGISVAKVTVGLISVANDVNSGMVTPLTISTLEDALTTLYTLPSFEVGSSSQSSFSATLMAGSTNITLEPNHPKQIYMYGITRLKIGGKKAFWANSRVESNFVMSLRGNGTTDPDDPDCCSPVIGVYILKSNLEAPTGVTELRNKVKDHFNDWPTWQIGNSGQLSSITNDFGVIRGLANGCNTEVISDRKSNDLNKDVPVGAIVKVDNGSIVIKNEENISCPQSCRYKLYDLSGKLLKSGEVVGESKIWSITDSQPGIYFVHIEKGGISTIKKIAIIK